MFTILGRGQVRLHRRAWERSFLCAYLIFADVLLHLKIQWQIRFWEKKNVFWKKIWKFFFENKFCRKFFFFFNFFFDKIFLNLQLMCQVSNLVSILNVISIVSFISQCTYNFTRLWFNISFHFEFQVSCLNTANKADGSAGSAKTVFHRNFVEFSI